MTDDENDSKVDSVLRSLDSIDGITISDPNRESLGRAVSSKNKPDFTVLAAEITECGTWGFVVSWDTVSAGFGQLTFFRENDGRFKLDTEAMSDGFVKEVLSKLVDETPEL